MFMQIEQVWPKLEGFLTDRQNMSFIIKKNIIASAVRCNGTCSTTGE